MKTIRRAFVLLLAVLMLVGMALPVCAEELAFDAEPIAEDSAPESTSEPEVTSEPETTPETTSVPETTPEPTTEPETTPEPDVTPEPTATPEPVPADEAAPLALESESETVFLTTDYPSMLQGGTFRLTQDLDLSGKTVKFNAYETVTLDLNGHTLTVGSLNWLTGANVTLTDSVGTGCINGPINVEPNSTLVLNGGTVTSTETSTLAGTIETGKGTTVFNGPVKISSGTIISGGVFKGAVENNGTISGGTFNGSVTGNGSITGGVFCGSVPTDKLPTDKPVYTVTFDLNGGTGNDTIHEQVFVGPTSAKAIKPATNPTRNGYNFIAWYKDGKPYDFTSSVTSSFTLKAEWASYGYTIKYQTEGGKLPSSYPTSYATGTTVTLPRPTRTGYRFDGWYKDRQFEGLPITTIGASDFGDKIFVAKWTPETYDIKYYGIDHATLPQDEKFNHYTIHSETLTLPIPSKEGFTFEGWYTNADLRGDAVTQIVTGTTGNQRFYAKWTENLPSGGGDNPTGGGKTPGSAGGSSEKAPSSASKPAIPKTGDDSMIALWLALAAVSALALGYVTARKRKN